MPIYGLAVILAVTGGVAGIWLFQQWAHQVGPQRSRRLLRNIAIAVVALLLVFLLIRAGSAIAAFVAVLLPFIVRALQLWTRFQNVANIFNGLKSNLGQTGSMGSGTSHDASSQSSIATRFLKMNLDHSNGEIQGKVISGQFSGKELAQLTFNELLELWLECQADAQSSAILEAYLDRTQDPDWREQVAAAERHNHGGDQSNLDKEDAYAILGIAPGATEAEIKAAHRRLMQKLHPDHGGSDYLAARINEAKDLLLRK